MPASSESDAKFEIPEDVHHHRWSRAFLEHVVKSNICATMFSDYDFHRPFFLLIVFPAFQLSCRPSGRASSS